PRGSDTNGSSNYDDLYADIRLWLEKGWIDYVTPQLYWQIGHRLADYETLLDWWSRNSFGRQLYIGHGIYR
ncbi:MAG TPA: family 10 glycosylhydrolase, partial [Chitinophagaceae bacterium]